MREIAILMTPEMSRATRLDMKTETRRLTGLEEVNVDPSNWTFRANTFNHADQKRYAMFNNKVDHSNPACIECPYGDINDWLWIRETWNKDGFGDFIFKADNMDDQVKRWRPNIHMPKFVARTWLQITDIKIERLHEIDDEGCIAEGIKRESDAFYFYPCNDLRDDSYIPNDPYTSFYSLWKSINKNAQSSWDLNPWVWVIKFQVMSLTGRPEYLNMKEVCHGN